MTAENVYVFERHYRGAQMAQGAKVRARNAFEASDKARALFAKPDNAEEMRHTRFVLVTINGKPPIGERS